MPLFIFISGYFSRKKDKKDFWPSIWKLLEPLIIFQIIALLFYKDSMKIKDIFTPWHMLWYLLSLIYWRIMLQIIPDKILKHKKQILISTFCLSILAGFLPFGKVLSIQRTLALFPFFILGYYMKDKNLYLLDKYKLLCMVSLLIILVLLFFYPHRINYLLYAASYKSIYGAVIRMVAFILAIPMSVAFLKVCYNTPWIARQGRMSMQYYIYHALIIPLLFMIISKLNVPFTFFTAAIITIIIALGISVFLRIRFAKTLTNPSLYINK